jgi:hypothetical protein
MSNTQLLFEGDINTGRGQFGFSEFFTLTGSVTLWTQFPDRPHRYFLDPNGTDRNVTLPEIGTGSANAQPGHHLIIKHTGVANTLTILGFDASTVTTLSTEDTVWLTAQTATSTWQVVGPLPPGADNPHTLQNAYDDSTSGADIQIGSNGPVNVKNDAADPSTQKLFHVTNNAKTTDFFVVQPISATQSSIGIGGGASSTTAGTISIGQAANASGVDSVAIGQSAAASGADAFAIGDNATASGARSFALGTSANTGSQAGAMVMSDGQAATTADTTNQLVQRFENGSLLLNSATSASVLPGTANNDPAYLIVQDFVETTNATPATVISYATDDDSAYNFSAEVTCVRTGGTGGVVGDSATFWLEVKAKNIAGTVTVFSTIKRRQRDMAIDASYVVSGTNLNVQVTGIANNDLRWHANLKVNPITYA